MSGFLAGHIGISILGGGMSFLLTALKTVLVIALCDLLQRVGSWVTDCSRSYSDLCDYREMDAVTESLGGDCIYRHHDAVYSLVTKEKQAVMLAASTWPPQQDRNNRNKALTITINDCFIKNRMVLLHCADSRSSIRLLSCLRGHGDPEALLHTIIVPLYLAACRFIPLRHYTASSIVYPLSSHTINTVFLLRFPLWRALSLIYTYQENP